MHSRYPHVFSPVRIGPVEVPNRTYFSPHGLPLTIGCAPSADLLAYCTERVRDGGCGLVILSCTVHERARHYQPCPYPADAVPGFRALADAIHAAGGKVFGQLWYWWGASGHWGPMSPPAPMLGPSAVQYGYRGLTQSAHAMGPGEITAMRAAFGQCVRHLREAGFDGVEIHGSHAGMIEQFLSPYYNRRTDRYGGSLENRMRLMVEVLETARAEAGEAMAVGMRFNCNELISGGYGEDTAREVIGRLRKAGLVDFLDLDVAMEPQQLELGMPPAFIAPQVYRPHLEAVREAAGDVPVISVLGRVTELAQAEEALAVGLCDMVGSGRQLIAEPRFVALARAGREDEARTCVACNWCLGGMGEGAFGCAINPASYRERQWGENSFTPAAKACRVVVVGGGPAGLEAARVAARRGHAVTLLEARERLGGGLALWGELAPFGVLHRQIDWWRRELARLEVDVRMGAEASTATVLALAPDAVIVATGGRFCREGRSGFLDQPIAGAASAQVLTPDDVMLERTQVHGSVVIADGEGTHATLALAERLAREGHAVTLVSPNFAPFSQRVDDALESRQVARRLAEARVRFEAATWVESIGESSVKLRGVHDDVVRELAADTVILATGRHAGEALSDGLADKVAQLYVIGDALAVRPWATAAYEGQKFARLIGEPGAPANVAEAWFAPDDPAFWPLPAGG